MRIALALAVFLAATLLHPPGIHAQGARLHGRVLDSRTGEPIAKATVSIREREIETLTAGNGEFELNGVQPGEVEIYVTTVGYALVRRNIQVLASTPIELELLLGPDVMRRTDEITVTEKTFVAPEPAGVSDRTLTQEEIKNLTSVLIDDPLRSVQALPGVTSGDDFYAQFSARGAGFRSIGYSTDGILIFAPMHEVASCLATAGRMWRSGIGSGSSPTASQSIHRSVTTARC